MGPVTTPAIDVRHFGMRFGAKTVIDDLSFAVAPGETFGLLGSNGSGKTTTIRALLGIYQPTSGELLVDGRRYDPSVHASLGYLPEERGLYKRDAVIDVMTYFGRLKGMSAPDAAAWSMTYLERVALASHAKTRLDKLSGGQQQKVQLGVTIMNQPRLLILDEPTKGFDPVNRRLLLDIVDDQKRAGATVLMVTHQMEEVERLCDRILLLKDGAARAYGTIPEVQDAFGGRTIRLGFTGTLPDDPAYVVRTRERNYAELELAEGADPQAVLRTLLDAGVQIRSFEAGRTSLEDIFLTVYGSHPQD